MTEPGVIYSETELVFLLKQKGRDAFNYLYRQYSAALYGIITNVVPDEQIAEDVLQEAFVKIWNNIEQYDSRKGRLFTWMINIARNAAIDKLRSKGEIMHGKIQLGEDFVNNEGMKTEQLIDSIGLRKIVATLKPEYEVIIRLAYFNGYSMDEISKTLEIPIGTVKTRTRHAIQQLREIFKN